MVNQNPGVEQSESGVEWLINNGSTVEGFFSTENKQYNELNILI